jgi:hypothetical protein
MFIYNKVSKLRFGPAANIIDEEWDHLLILDACRYDTFKQENGLSGRLDHRISKGSVTGQFVIKNFDATYPDTVYITANPHASRLISDRFHDFFHAWQTHWNDELNTVPPDKMSELVSEISDRYPNKRIIAHYVQPHEPFLGQEAKNHQTTGGLVKARSKAEGVKDSDMEPTLMEKFRQGQVTRKVALRAYRETLEAALEEVEELLPELDGRTVITSDHGEMFGERAWPLPIKKVGHFENYRTLELVKVPWFVIPSEERRTIRSGNISSEQTNHENEAIEKLRALGYLQE